MIRKASKQDTDKIMQIWLQASLKAHQFIAEDYWKNKALEVREVYLPQAETFVYEDKRQIKGFVSVILDNFIGALFVDVSFQRKNIGSKLLDYVRQNRPNLTLRVYAKNLAALNFYQKNDFKILVEKLDEHTSEKELIMSWAKGCKSGYAKKNKEDS